MHAGFKTIIPAAIGAVVAIAALSFSRMQTTVDNPAKTHRIVFQVSTPDTLAYRALTRQLNNVLAQWPEAQIEVVAHNKGMALLQKEKSNVPAELEALKAKGIRFLACEQTLRQQKLNKSDILPAAGFVERGIVEIVEKQEKGWSYIKAGF